MLIFRAPFAVGGLIALAAVFTARSAAPQFFSQVTRPGHILEGHWQSCQEPPGGPYAERVYDHVVNGVGQFEVHLGPYREFAVFQGVQDDHRAHGSPENLLKPYRVAIGGSRAGHRWEVPSLNVAFSVARGGGARADCESWFVLLESFDRTSD